MTKFLKNKDLYQLKYWIKMSQIFFILKAVGKFVIIIITFPGELAVIPQVWFYKNTGNLAKRDYIWRVLTQKEVSTQW